MTCRFPRVLDITNGAGEPLNNPGPVDDICQDNAHQAGASNHHHISGSGANLMVRPSLDDTLHAIVQLTHEHGLPLTSVNVRAGDVQVHTGPADRLWWVRWLTDPVADASRCVVWEIGQETDAVALHVSARREHIDWVVINDVPGAVAHPVLGLHNVLATSHHLEVSADVAIALASAAAQPADPGCVPVGGEQS